MKHLFLAIALMLSGNAIAQVLHVESVAPLSTPQGTVAVAMSSQGDFLLLSSPTNSGLSKFNIASGETTVITDAPGAGFDAQISPDGQNVVFRKTTFDKNHLRKVSLHSIDLISGKQQQLAAPSRNLQGVAFENATLQTVDNGKLKSRALRGKKQSTQPVFSISNRQLMITVNGKTSVFSPCGTDHSYLWPSLSPDGTKALFYVAADGAYVCNIDGTGLTRLGVLRAPVWFGNDVVLGMLDIDNGEFVTESSIIAASLTTGGQQVLTSPDVIAMYPQGSAASGNIAFSSTDGRVYIIKTNK